MAISGNIPNAMGHLLHSLSMGVGGIMVSIAAFQAVDPGSIPGRRIFIQHFLIIIYTSQLVLVYLHVGSLV